MLPFIKALDTHLVCEKSTGVRRSTVTVRSTLRTFEFSCELACLNTRTTSRGSTSSRGGSCDVKRRRIQPVQGDAKVKCPASASVSLKFFRADRAKTACATRECVQFLRRRAAKPSWIYTIKAHIVYDHHHFLETAHLLKMKPLAPETRRFIDGAVESGTFTCSGVPDAVCYLTVWP